MITDSQIHLWEANRPDRPWTDISQPNLPEPYGPERFLPVLDAAGVDRAVIVPPGFMGTHNEYGLECAERHPTRLAVMGFGEHRPLEPNKPNQKGNPVNRRVEIYIIPSGQIRTVPATGS